ncbi:MAG TPA: helicase-related protein, partial [Nevskiaceae bacterium]|nr:helicase-related protein [Nevskiaceae bacterium]
HFSDHRHGVHLFKSLLVKNPAERLGYPGQFSVGIRPISGSVLDRPQHDKPIELPQEAGIQDVFRHLASDEGRTTAVAAAIHDAYEQGRKVLVLTERTDHLDAIAAALLDKVPVPFILHGRMSRRQRVKRVTDLDALPSDEPRVLLATGKLVGEGFDHPPLDTLVLAMPVSWKGTLQQYVGRLHREHASKTDVRVIDFIDTGHPALLRMWDKRQRGYRAMGYRVAAACP